MFVSKLKHSIRICLVYIFIFSVFTGTLYAQVSLETFLKKIEIVTNRAAECWLDKNYTKALDVLYKTNDLLTDHSFPPTDHFAWEACRSIKTYIIVFSRIVEAKWYQDKNDKKNAEKMRKQAKEWAAILESQAYVWSKVKPNSNEDAKLRKKWFKRFSSIITALHGKNTH